MAPSTPGPGFRTPRQFNSSAHTHFNDFSPSLRMSPRNVKFDFDSKSPDCLQLCMDVPFPDHPYLIGPRGRKSQYFMTRYKSLIHFPDTNCRTDGVKLNNVLVSGKMKNVEEIRSQMRLRTPVRIIIQLRQFQHYEKVVHRIEEAISERSLPIRFNYSDDYCNGVLKTEWRNEELLVDFCEEFLSAKHLNKNAETSELFTLAIALLPLINPWNQELSHRLVGNLFEQTGCRVFYPTKEKYVTEPPTYFVKGASVGGLLQSGKYLMGLTMLQITFHLPPNTIPSVEQQSLNDWQQNLLVHTTIFNPSPNDSAPQFKVTLRSFEFCINGLYIVRSALLGFKKSVHTISYDFMKFAKHIIPYTVYADAKLYYPLYSIDDKSLNWSSAEFFDRFYGGPYSLIQGPDGTNNAHDCDEDESHMVHNNNNSFRRQKMVVAGNSEEEEGSELEQQQAHPEPSSLASLAPPLFEPPAPKPYTQADFHFIHHVPSQQMHHHHSSSMGLDQNNNAPQFVFFHAIDSNNNSPASSTIGGILPHHSSPANGASSSSNALVPLSSDIMLR